MKSGCVADLRDRQNRGGAWSPLVPDLTGWINGTKLTHHFAQQKCDDDWTRCGTSSARPSPGLTLSLPMLIMLASASIGCLASHRAQETARAAYVH
jgi:hypothetical protein